MACIVNVRGFEARIGYFVGFLIEGVTPVVVCVVNVGGFEARLGYFVGFLIEGVT